MARTWRFVGLAPEGQDRRVLEEQQRVGNVAGGPVVDEPLLERPCLAIIDPPQPAHVERFGARGQAAGRDRLDQDLHSGTIAGRDGRPVRRHGGACCFERQPPGRCGPGGCAILIGGRGYCWGSQAFQASG